MAIRVQIMDEALFISHNAKTLEKGCNPTILSQAMSKQEDKLSPFTLVWQPAFKKENS